MDTRRLALKYNLGHTGVWGNEWADLLVSRAAVIDLYMTDKGDSEDYECLLVEDAVTG